MSFSHVLWGRGCPLQSHEAQCSPRGQDPPVLWSWGCFLPGVPAALPTPGPWVPARPGLGLLDGASAPWLTSQLHVTSCRSGHGALQEGSTQTRLWGWCFSSCSGEDPLEVRERPACSAAEVQEEGRGAVPSPGRPSGGLVRTERAELGEGFRHARSSQCGWVSSVTAVPTTRRAKATGAAYSTWLPNRVATAREVGRPERERPGRVGQPRSRERRVKGRNGQS